MRLQGNRQLKTLFNAIHSTGVWSSLKGASTHEARLLNFLTIFRR